MKKEDIDDKYQKKEGRNQFQRNDKYHVHINSTPIPLESIMVTFKT